MLTSILRPLGTKKAYITLTGDSDAMTLASKIGLIWSNWIDVFHIIFKKELNFLILVWFYYYLEMWKHMEYFFIYFLIC